jgi:hypothetical protein
MTTTPTTAGHRGGRRQVTWPADAGMLMGPRSSTPPTKARRSPGRGHRAAGSLREAAENPDHQHPPYGQAEGGGGEGESAVHHGFSSAGAAGCG